MTRRSWRRVDNDILYNVIHNTPHPHMRLSIVDVGYDRSRGKFLHGACMGTDLWT